MAGGSLKVKAILLKDGGEEGVKEIRRFRMEEGGKERLQMLLAQIHSIFNVDPASRQCALHWKDEDDDLVQFSSEEEFQHAVDNVSDDTLRVYVIISARDSKGSDGPQAKENASSGSAPNPFCQAPPPPPPPHPHHHPPHFGPWARGGWRRWNWKHMGRGGWQGGMNFGCPWMMDHDMPGCHWKGKGHFKHGWHKMKKTMKMMRPKNQQKEFKEVRLQVSPEFRRWVRLYVQTWYTQGPEAATTATTGMQLPDTIDQSFPPWLYNFLTNYNPQKEGDMETDEEMGPAPPFLPPVYFRWLCLYVSRFCRQMNYSNGGEGQGNCHSGGHCHGQRFCSRRGFGWAGKRGFCKKNWGGKHGFSSSSESEDSDSGHKAFHRVPKALRKFVRMSHKHTRTGKGQIAKIKEKAARAGISSEVQEFVIQAILEWCCKAAHRDGQTIAREMKEGERTLPSGLQREDFLWLIRFLARKDRRYRCGKWQAGPSACSSDDSSSEDTNGEEAMPEEQGCEPCTPFHPPPSGMAPGFPFMGMQGPPPPYAMYPGMNHPPPPPPHIHGMFSAPPPPPGFCPPYATQYPDRVTGYAGAMGDTTGSDQRKEKETAASTDDMVEKVTDGVKRM